MHSCVLIFCDFRQVNFVFHYISPYSLRPSLCVCVSVCESVCECFFQFVSTMQMAHIQSDQAASTLPPTPYFPLHTVCVKYSQPGRGMKEEGETERGLRTGG